MALIANLVCRNEADRYLKQVLDDLLLYVDDIVVTDDCSTDNTVEIVKDYTNHVYSTDEPLFCVNEGQLRQEAWRNLDNHAVYGDWILCIDADEIVYSTKQPIAELIQTTKYDVLALEFINMWNPTHYRVDKAWKPMLCTKLFRYMKNGRIRDRVLACGSEPTYVEKSIQMNRWMKDSGLKIQHLGYMRDEDKKTKYDRYMKIDGGKFHSGAHLKSIMDKKVELVEWDFERFI